MSKKTKLTDKEKEIIKKVTDYIQYVPDEQKIYILGVVDTVGMLCRDEKAGQEGKMRGYYYPENASEEEKSSVPTGTLQIEMANLQEIIHKLSCFNLNINFAVKDSATKIEGKALCQAVQDKQQRNKNGYKEK